MATYEEIISDYSDCSITNNQAVDALMAIGWENNEDHPTDPIYLLKQPIMSLK